MCLKHVTRISDDSEASCLKQKQASEANVQKILTKVTMMGNIIDDDEIYIIT